MASVLGQRCPIVTLDNGLTVVNYGSNHQYKFKTGEVLEACSDDVCRETSLISKHDYDVIVQDNNGGTFRFTLSNSKDNVYYNTTDKWKEYIMKVLTKNGFDITEFSQRFDNYSCIVNEELSFE